MRTLGEEMVQESKTPLVDASGRRIRPGHTLVSQCGFRAKVVVVHLFTVVLDRGNFKSAILRLSIKGGGWRIVEADGT